MKPKNLLTIALLLVNGLAFVVGIGTILFSHYQESQAHALNLCLSSVIKATHAAYSQSGKFPDSLARIGSQVWPGQALVFSADGRVVTVGNYRYVYTRDSETTASCWAIPVGPQAATGRTKFVTMTPLYLRTWDGPPLTAAQTAEVTGTPTATTLSFLGFVEKAQPTPTAGQTATNPAPPR